MTGRLVAELAGSGVRGCEDAKNLHRVSMARNDSARRNRITSNRYCIGIVTRF